MFFNISSLMQIPRHSTTSRWTSNHRITVQSTYMQSSAQPVCYQALDSLGSTASTKWHCTSHVALYYKTSMHVWTKFIWYDVKCTVYKNKNARFFLKILWCNVGFAGHRKSWALTTSRKLIYKPTHKSSRNRQQRPEETECWTAIQQNAQQLKHVASIAQWKTAGDTVAAHQEMVSLSLTVTLHHGQKLVWNSPKS